VSSVTIRHGTTDTIGNLNSGELRVGWFPSARYDDEKNTPVASVAAQNEYGNPNKNIPARPFIRPAIAADSQKWQATGRRGFKSVLAGQSTVTQVLENIGEQIVGDIQYSISRVYEPALSKRTVDERLARRNATRSRVNKTQARSITKPLIDTGHMQATVSYEIGGGE